MMMMMMMMMMMILIQNLGLMGHSKGTYSFLGHFQVTLAFMCKVITNLRPR